MPLHALVMTGCHSGIYRCYVDSTHEVLVRVAAVRLAEAEIHELIGFSWPLIAKILL